MLVGRCDTPRVMARPRKDCPVGRGCGRNVCCSGNLKGESGLGALRELGEAALNRSRKGFCFQVRYASYSSWPLLR